MTVSAWEFGRRLARNERRLVAYMKANPGATTAEVRSAAGIEAVRALPHLVRIGHVAREGTGGRGDPYRHYYVRPSV